MSYPLNLFFMLLLIFSVVSIPKDSSAYYHVPAESEPTVRLKVEADNYDVSKNTSEFSLFSNGDVPAGTDTPYIVPGPKEFVPADAVPANQILQLSIRKPIRADSALSGMLYANLKLQRLIEMYGELQRNASEVLSGLSVPVVETHTPSAGGGSGSGTSLSQKRNELFSAHQSIARRYATAGHYNSRSLSLNGGEPEGVSSGQVETLSTAANRLRADEGDSQEGVKARLLSFEEESWISETDPQGSSSSMNGRPMEDASLPWIFEVGLNLVKYLFSHKIEAIILGVIFMGLGMFISSIGRR